MKSGAPISLQDPNNNNVSIQTDPDENSYTLNGGDNTGSKKSQRTVIQIKMGEDPACKQSQDKLAQILNLSMDAGKRSIRSPQSSYRGDTDRKEKRIRLSQHQTHPVVTKEATPEPQTVMLTQNEKDKEL